jgi:hypothetical protein
MSLAHLHLILNHVPVIGMGFVLLILAIAAWRRDSANAKLGLSILIGLATVTAIVFVTGEPAEEAVEGIAGVSETMIHPHEEAAELALIATAVSGTLGALALVAYRRRPLPMWVMGTALAVALGVSATLGWTATLGGQIRHTEIGGVRAASSESGDERR